MEYVTIRHVSGNVNRYVLKDGKDTRVSFIIEQVQKETHENVEGIRLVYRGKGLSEDKSLEDCGIPKGSTLDVHTRLLGGNACASFIFANMQNSTQRGFGKTAPKYRIIHPGFNLEGYCLNAQCEAYNKKAWCPLGYSPSPQKIKSPYECPAFNIAMKIYEATCPSCKGRLDPKSVTSCGFYKCQYTYEGIREGMGEKTTGSGCAKADDCFEYHNGTLDGERWLSLLIVVNEL